MKDVIITAVLLTICLLNVQALAADNSVQCTSIESNKVTSCFEGTHKSSDKLSKLLFLYLSGDIDDMSLIDKQVDIWQNKVLSDVNDIKGSFIDFEPYINEYADAYNSDQLPPLLVPLSLGKFTKVKLNGETFNKYPNKQCKKVFNAKNCEALFEQFRSGMESPYKLIDKEKYLKTAQAIGLRNQKWKNYFANSRSQTFIDLAVNTLYYKDALKSDSLVPPPKKQYFALHPSIVMHYSNDADKGERMKEALAIEWFGVNYWDRSTPLGWSVVSTYADRASVKSIAHGLMLHVNNSYSFGFTTNSKKEYGIFLSIDLLKLFETKQSNYKSYLSKLKDL